jgi:hypothetical protein
MKLHKSLMYGLVILPFFLFIFLSLLFGMDYSNSPSNSISVGGITVGQTVIKGDTGNAGFGQTTFASGNNMPLLQLKSNTTAPTTCASGDAGFFVKDGSVYAFTWDGATGCNTYNLTP